MPGGAWAGAQDKQPAVGGSPRPGAHARATCWPARGAKYAAGAGQARVAKEDAMDAHGHSMVRRAARPKSCNPGGWLGRVCVSGGRTRTSTGDGPQPRPPPLRGPPFGGCRAAAPRCGTWAGRRAVAVLHGPARGLAGGSGRQWHLP